MTILIGENMMNGTWTEVAAAAGRKALVLLPVGVIEEHGPHLCLATDVYTAELYCASAKRELENRGLPAVVAPPFCWGVCQSTGGFIGSFQIRKETAKNLLLDILASLKRFGFDEVYGVNAHGDIEQNILLMEAFREAAETHGMAARCLFRREVLHLYGLTGDEPYICALEPQSIRISDCPEPDVHAGQIETAVIHKFLPGLVDVSAAERLPARTIPEGREMEWLLGGKTKEMSENGYIGNPAKFREVDVENHILDTTNRIVEAILKKRGTSRR